ncbi:MAG TPA: polysaccharide biosynthesis C-terminal domain-containing protein [Gaiellaceae bacterium]|nr:polysaccharide biosynthesis C-terminal domain-containing protein [Gaiellaceae bacterium]
MKGARGGTLVPPRDLRLPEAGSAAIRGGALRTGGYLTGTALIAAASVLLLRHLGVTDFGRYVTVMSLVAVVSGLTDAGLTLVGQREYVVAPTPEAKRDLLANVLGIRLAVAPVGIGLAALFALAAGYTTAMTLGTLLAGSGLMLAFAAHTLTTPLTTSLRLGALTITELARDAVMFAGIGLLVLAGAGLLPFFTPHIAAGAIQLGLTLALVGAAATRPRFAFARWWPLIREAAPVGAALIVNVLYLRALVVMTSLLASAFATGLFATSYRILEVVVGIPTAMMSAAFPILAHAGSEDEERLAYALQRLAEVALLVAGLLVLVLAIGAEPIVRILGGHAYAGAGPVLRIQCFALLGTFAGSVWTAALVAVRRQSALILTNAVAFATILVLGSSLIPVLGAKGAALAAVIGEAIVALAALAMLVRTRPALAPDPRFVPKLLAAGAAGALCLLVPGLPALGSAALAGGVYLAAAAVVRAVPPDLVHALRAR